MKLTDNSTERFTELLASKTSVPGGGGASALVGAVGIALGDMVGEFTVGKKSYAAVEPEILALMEQAQALRKSLLDCVEQDAEAFEPLSRAYGIPKETPGRDETLEKCLRDAAAAPLRIFDLCVEAISICRAFGEKGSKLMISDVATGIMFCQAAMYGAAVNVRVNTKLMKDRSYAEELNAHLDSRLESAAAEAKTVFNRIYSSF